jgi:hypothetical protein
MWVPHDCLNLGFCTLYASHVSTFRNVSIFMVTELLDVCAFVIWKKICKFVQDGLRLTGQSQLREEGHRIDPSQLEFNLRNMRVPYHYTCLRLFYLELSIGTFAVNKRCTTYQAPNVTHNIHSVLNIII